VRIRNMIFGGLLGAAAAYLFDPDNGRGRRTRLLDMGGARVRRAKDTAEKKTRYLEGVAQGVKHDLTTPAYQEEEVDDAKLVARVKSEVLGREGVPKGSIDVEAVDGVIRLRGQVARQQDIDDLMGAVIEVPGVKEVESLLHLPDEDAPNKVPARQASQDAEQES
jgi:osmotically-inducible protein OsmY